MEKYSKNHVFESKCPNKNSTMQNGPENEDCLHKDLKQFRMFLWRYLVMVFEK